MAQDIHPEERNHITETEQFQKYNDRILHNLQMDYYDPMHIENRPDGMDYRWVRHTLFGDPSFTQIPMSKAKGWVEVPRSRHPELFFIDGGTSGDQRNLWIEFKGSILMERPKFYGDIERKNIDDFHANQIKNAAGNSLYAQQNGGPLRVLSDSVSYTSESGGFKE